jgi:hypothetical protein
MRQRLRTAALGGFGFVAFYIVHRILQGAGPSGPEAQAVSAFYTEHRGALLASEVLAGLAVLSFILVPAGLIPVVRGMGDDVMAVALVVSGSAFVTLGLVSVAAEGALIRVAGAGHEAAIVALNYLQALLPIVLALAAVAATASVAVLRTGLLPRWFGVAGLVAALVFLLGGVFGTLGDTPEGPGSIYGIALAIAWVALLSGLLWWRAGKPETT